MSPKMISLIRIGLVVLTAVVTSECIREPARSPPQGQGVHVPGY